MSQNPQPPDHLHQTTDQDRLHYSAPSPVQYTPAAPQPYYLQTPTMTSTLPHAPVSLPPHNVQSVTPAQHPHRNQFAVFDAVATHQTHPNDLYSHPADPPNLMPQPPVTQPALTSASITGQLNNPADLLSYQGQSKPQYPPSIWPTDQTRQEASTTALPQPVVASHRDTSLGPPPQQSMSYNAPLGHGVTRKRERPMDNFFAHPPQQEGVLATTATTLSDEGPSIDTRKGKERVQRPCTNCGEMNHIRKNKCWKCDKPKEPAKKRTKRVRRKKNKLQMQVQGARPLPGTSLPLHRGVMQPEMNSVSIDRAESLVRVAFPAHDEVPNMFDSRNFTVLQSTQPQTLQSSEVPPQHGPAATQRGMREFTEGTTFEETQPSGPQNHQVDRDFR